MQPAAGRRRPTKGKGANERAPVSVNTGSIVIYIHVSSCYHRTVYPTCFGQLTNPSPPPQIPSLPLSTAGSSKISPAKKVTPKFHLSKEQRASIAADALNAKLWDRLLHPGKGEGSQVLVTDTDGQVGWLSR